MAVGSKVTPSAALTPLTPACDGRTEAFHEESPCGIGVPGLVPAGHRDRNLIEGVGVLSAAEEQAGVIG